MPSSPAPFIPRPPPGSGVREPGSAPTCPPGRAGKGGGWWLLRRARARAGLEPAASLLPSVPLGGGSSRSSPGSGAASSLSFSSPGAR